MRTRRGAIFYVRENGKNNSRANENAGKTWYNNGMIPLHHFIIFFVSFWSGMAIMILVFAIFYQRTERNLLAYFINLFRRMDSGELDRQWVLGNIREKLDEWQGK